MRRLLFLLLACACAGRGVAQVTVYSQRADATSLTIYRDGLALITETRNVELPAGPVTLVFRGVVDSLLAQSAVMNGAERPLAETNFSFDRLTPESLIERSVGKKVTVVRTNERSGRVTRLEAIVLSAADGVVLQSVDGNEVLHCAGLPEQLELSEVPDELNATPTLSVQLAAGAAGKRTITVSYLARGFKWSSDYVAHLNDAANRMDLTGWVTLQNLSHSSFSQAQVQVVAGKLNLLPQEDGGSETDLEEYENADDEDASEDADVASFTRCYVTAGSSISTSTFDGRSERYFSDIGYGGGEGLEAIMVTSSRVQREELGDYQLYRLPWPTDLNARQTKQAVFLSKPKVKVERFYSVRVNDYTDSAVEPEDVPNLMLRWENKKSAGLGEPLPSGTVRVFERYAGSDVFAGEAQIKDKPTGLPVEIAIGRAMNLTSDFTREEEDSEEDDDRSWVTVRALHHFINRKDVPVSIEVRHAGTRGLGTPVVVKSNIRAGKKYGDLAWRFTVPPESEKSLRYALKAAEPKEPDEESEGDSDEDSDE